MLYTHGWTKRPREALLLLCIDFLLDDVERRWEPQGANGTPPFAGERSYLADEAGNIAWEVVYLGRMPPKR